MAKKRSGVGALAWREGGKTDEAVRAQASFDSIAAHLKPGQHVRVHAAGGPRLEGRLAAVTTAPPVLQITVGDTAQPVRVADSLWVRGSATVTGMVVGGAVFALAGAVVLPAHF